MSRTLAISNWALRISVVWGVLTGILASSFAADIYSVMREVVERHPNIVAAQRLEEAAEFQRKKAFASYFPELSLNAEGGRELRDSAVSHSSLTGGSVELKLTQTLFDAGKISYMVQAADALKQVASYEIKIRAMRNALDAAAVYLDVLRTQEQVVLARRHLDNMEKIAIQIKRSAELDSGLRSQLRISETQMVDARVQKISAEVAYKAASKVFAQLVGRQVGKLQAVNGDKLGVPSSIDSAMAMASASHPSIAAAGFNVDEQRARARAANSDYLPKLELEARGKLGHNLSGVEDFSNEAYIGLKLSFKLGIGGGQYYDNQAAKSRYYAATEDEEATVLSVNRQVIAAWSRYETAKLTYPEYAKKARTAAKKLEDFEIEVEAGAALPVEAFFVHAENFSTKQRQIDARYNVLTSSFGLLAATGSLHVD